MSRTCKTCGSTDFTPAGKCRPCKKAENARYVAKKAAGGGSRVKASSKTATVSKSEAAPKRLEVEAGFGFRAEITAEGFLQIQQANQEGELTDTVVLTKGEARRLFEEFRGWAT